MNKKQLNKMATADAVEWCRLNALSEELDKLGIPMYQRLQECGARSPEYQDAFNRAYKALDYDAARRNASDILSVTNVAPKPKGGHKMLKLGVAALGLYILHETGYDRVLWQKGQSHYNDLKARLKKATDDGQ